MRIMVTGYAGFIGTNLVRRLFNTVEDVSVIGVDAFTYAARPGWAKQFIDENGLRNRFLVHQADLAMSHEARGVISATRPDHIIHLAAESHVCRSIESPLKFFKANVDGTANTLQAALEIWGSEQSHVFHHVSTDEVFGDLGPNDDPFCEMSRYAPRSPYAASKAGSDMAVMAYAQTFGMNTRITNCSNNFGPNQHEEKLIPKTILSILNGRPVKLYGSGQQVRDWLWVDDHCDAIIQTLLRGRPGSRYCVGGNMEMTNLGMVQKIHRHICAAKGEELPLEIVYTNDRPNDDRRYAVDTFRIQNEIGWSPSTQFFDNRLRMTIDWYVDRMKTEGRGPDGLGPIAQGRSSAPPQETL